MWVAPAARGLGVGRRLLAELEARGGRAAAPRRAARDQPRRCRGDRHVPLGRLREVDGVQRRAVRPPLVREAPRGPARPPHRAAAHPPAPRRRSPPTARASRCRPPAPPARRPPGRCRRPARRAPRPPRPARAARPARARTSARRSAGSPDRRRRARARRGGWRTPRACAPGALSAASAPCSASQRRVVLAPAPPRTPPRRRPAPARARPAAARAWSRSARRASTGARPASRGDVRERQPRDAALADHAPRRGEHLGVAAGAWRPGHVISEWIFGIVHRMDLETTSRSSPAPPAAAGAASRSSSAPRGATVYVTGRSTRGRPLRHGPPGDDRGDRRSSSTPPAGAGSRSRVDHTDPRRRCARSSRASRDEQDGRLDVLVNDIWGGDPLTPWDAPFWEHDLDDGLGDAAQRASGAPDHRARACR